MISMDTYRIIKRLKGLGSGKSVISGHLGISRTTLNKFWDMGYADFERLFYDRNKILDISRYKKLILNWIAEDRKLSAVELREMLLAHAGVSYSERTVSRYLKDVRDRYKICKCV